MSNIQAIIRKTFTVSITFAGKPDPATITKLKAEGFKYENGNWYKPESESRVIVESEVAQQIAA